MLTIPAQTKDLDKHTNQDIAGLIQLLRWFGIKFTYEEK